MHDYDAALKLLLRRSARVTMRELTGVSVEKWLDIELPNVQTLRADLVGEAADQSLIHLELQSTNDASMPRRMLDYYLGIQRLRGKYPRQLCLYVGESMLRMPTELRTAELCFRYVAVDIRSLDGDRLLESPDIGDNVIAVLARLRDHRSAIRRIMARVAELPHGARAAALAQLLTLSGLRKLEELVEQEARKMPIHIDIMENKVLGREYKRGLLEGIKEGQQKGEVTVLRRLLEKRFGPLPSWAEQRLTSKSIPELEDLSLRLLDASTLEELLK
jgi:hypothetical protein